MKFTVGTCWYCKKPVNLYARNAEAGRQIDYAGKVMFEHLTCGDKANKPQQPESEKCNSKTQ